MQSGFHFFNGKFVEKDKCFLHISDLSIQRSFAVFDYFIYMDKVPLYIDDYINRFKNSVRSMGLEHKMSSKDIKNAVLELIQMNKVQNGGIKFIYTGGYSRNGYDAEDPNFIIMQLEFPIVPEHHYENGIKLLLEEYTRDFPQAKTTDYFFSLSLKKKLAETNSFDVLYHTDGKITESSRSNFFMIDKNDNIITTDRGILFGVTRKQLIDSIIDKKQFIKREIHIDELANMKEAFLTSTVKRVIPVVQIGDINIGNGKVGNKTMLLREQLMQLDRKYIQENSIHS